LNNTSFTRKSTSYGKRPAQMTDEDLKDPQNMANNSCMSYLEAMIPKLNDQIQASIKEGTRPDPRIRTLWMDMQKRKNVIMQAC